VDADPLNARLSEAALALLAAQTGDLQLRRAARRRYRLLVAPPTHRLLKGRSIRSVARAAGIHYSALSRILRGQHDLFTQQAKRLADVLGIPIQDLIEHLHTVQRQPLPRHR
jgi:lambda repressor-like predicted transcriptional regulator